VLGTPSAPSNTTPPPTPLGVAPQSTTPQPAPDTIALPEFVTLAHEIVDIHDGVMFTIPQGFKCRVATQDTSSSAGSHNIRVLAWSSAHAAVIPVTIFTDDTIELSLDNTIQQILDDNTPRIPRPYQEYGIDYFLFTKPAANAYGTPLQGGSGRLNSDAPGLGKTLIGSLAAHIIMECAYYRQHPITQSYGTAAVPPPSEVPTPPWPHTPPPAPPAQCKRCHVIHPTVTITAPAPTDWAGTPTGAPTLVRSCPTLSDDGLCRGCILALEPIGTDSEFATYGSGIPSMPPQSIMAALPPLLMQPTAAPQDGATAPVGTPSPAPVVAELPPANGAEPMGVVPGALGHADGPYITLVMVPRHLANQWFKHIRRQHPKAYVNNTVGGGKNERLGYFDLPPTHAPMADATPEYNPHDGTWSLARDYTQPYTAAFYIVNYEALRSDEYYFALCKLLGSGRVLCILGDESHRLKNADSIQGTRYAMLANGAAFPAIQDYSTTKASAAAKDLHATVHAYLVANCAIYNEKNRLPAVPYKWLLSATPVKREADDLWHQCHILDPFTFSGKWKFLSDYCTYSAGGYHTVSNVKLRGWAERHLHFNPLYPDQVTPPSAPLQPGEHITMDNPNRLGIILGRSYKDVGMYLPDLLPVTLPVQMEVAARKQYDELRDFWRLTVSSWPDDGTIELKSFIAVYHALRMFTACDNKFDAVSQIMEDNPGPYVIFHKYELTAARLADKLGTKYISSTTVPDADARAPYARELMQSPSQAVISTFCLGEGVDLSAAKTLIFFEEDTTPGAMQQAIARVQRHDTTLATTRTLDDGTVVQEQGQKDPIVCFYINCLDSIDERVHAVQNDRALSIKDIVTMELAL